MQSFFARFTADESGATAIEYGLIAALVGAAIIASLGTLKTAMSNTYTTAGTTMTSAN